MARWEPDAEERLRRAAVDLFVDRGYDAVTVADIAERAGLTRRSFFRYFPDKREVLFAGSSRLVDEIERRLEAIGADGSMENTLIGVFAEAGTLLLGDRDAQRLRREIIASSPELQERDRTKLAGIAAAIARSMRRRGGNPADAELLGVLWAEAFRSAHERALADDRRLGFDEHLSAALRVIGSFPAQFASRAT